LTVGCGRERRLNKRPATRIRYRKVDAETGNEVPLDNIIKGYEVSKGVPRTLGSKHREEQIMEGHMKIIIAATVTKSQWSRHRLDSGSEPVGIS
jgi:DNA end-binding protein Ku